MSRFLRSVLVDDTNSDIKYNGSWFSDVGSWDSVGSNGIPYLRTLHWTSSNASFTLDFTGSAIRVIGSMRGSSSMYWTCVVDGDDTIMRSNNFSGSPLNNFEFCYVYLPKDGHHTLTVHATATANQLFWLDRIEYTPSQQVSIGNEAIGVTKGGPGLDSSALTAFVFTFNGVSVSWYGTIFASNPGNLSWTMDNADANYISNWNTAPSNASYPLHNQKFFETPTYPNGPHTLRVSYIANRSNLQLGFDYLTFQPSRTTGQISNSTTGTNVAKPGHIPGGAIAGCVVGSLLVFLIIAILCFYLYRRRPKAKRNTEVYSDEPFPFDQKPAYIPPLQRYPVQRKSRLFTNDRNIVANDDHPPDRSHTNQSPPMYEPSASITNGLSPQNVRDHKFPESMASSNAVDVGRGGLVVPQAPMRIVVHQDSGIRLFGDALATPPAANP